MCCPQVSPFTGFRLPYVFLADCISALTGMFEHDAVWNFLHLATDRDYPQLTQPWSQVCQLCGVLSLPPSLPPPIQPHVILIAHHNPSPCCVPCFMLPSLLRRLPLCV